MSKKPDIDDEDTSIGSTEMRALRRLTDPVTAQILPQQDELWAARYRIVEPIGHGGMGDVFLAQDVLLDRPVALKILRTTSEEVLEDARRTLREARTAARADHERVARIYDVGTWGNQSFIAMEHVRGETLRAWMKRHRATTQQVVVILQELLDALQALHKRDIVHRDLKPENIMVNPEGRLRILDLGVARRIEILDVQPGGDADALGSLSAGVGVGTPGYMAPEQWRKGDVDARADIFALGVIAYELVTSSNPFRGGAIPEIRERTLNGQIAFDGECWEQIPPELKAAIRIALARDPEQRHRNVAAFAAALGPLLPPSHVPPSLPPLSSSGVDRNAPPSTPSTSSSLGSTALGVSVRVLTKKRRWWLVPVGIVALGIGLALRLRQQPLAPPTRGMVQFRASTFTMGSEPTEIEAACRTYTNSCPHEMQNETPSKTVTVAPFELDEREVTNEEFAKFLIMIGASLSVAEDDELHYPRLVRYVQRPGEEFLLYDLWERSAGLALSGPSHFYAKPGFDRLPVTLVTWLGAQLYCKSVGKRLPTEAEWEYAARGTEKRPFPWGSNMPTCEGVHIPSDGTLRVLNPERCENSRVIPFPVMTAPQDRTPQGVYDLGGNVVEWVDDNDVHGDQADTSRLRVERPAVVRGGAYDSSFYTRTTSRSFRLAFNAGYDLGFRCAKSTNMSR